MEITDVIIRKRFENGTLYAIVSVILDGVLAVHGIKAAKTKDGGLIAVMPSYMDGMGNRHDTVHPTTADFRSRLESAIAQKLLI